MIGRILGLVAVGLGLGAACAVAQPERAAQAAPTAQPPPRVFWLQKPSRDELLASYPRDALMRRLSGHAVMRCAVTISGTLDGCSIVAEAPAADGFGAAALKLARNFRISATNPDGSPVGGAHVTIPISFSPP